MASRLLVDAEMRLIDAFVIGQNAYEHDNPGRTIIITCTNRSIAEQQILYAQGRTTPGQIVTNLDGVTKKSKHNFEPALAIDIAVLIGGQISWLPSEYKKVAPYFKRVGIMWGGDWSSFRDFPHFEL